jgi:hypothetical protein
MSETRPAPAYAKRGRPDPDLFSQDEADRLRFLRWLVEHRRLSDWGPAAAGRDQPQAA